MRLSILDQVPVTEHTPRSSAVTSGLRLAAEAEELGYHRIWFAEHHLSSAFAGTAPEIMTALALERTRTVRVGTGGILLPLYPVSKVREVMTLLDEAHPGRVDLGVGRAAFDDPQYGEKIALLSSLLPAHATAGDQPAGRVWVLGAGGTAAGLAGALGTGYAHGHFFVPDGGERATGAYHQAAAQAGHRTHTVVAVRAVTAPSDAGATALGHAMLLWRARKDLGEEGPVPSVETVRRHRWSEAERARARARARGVVFGTPQEVATELRALATSHGADEIVVNTLVSDPEDRQLSYRLLAEQFRGDLPEEPRSVDGS
ncbi:LLM class flavin-dependent oxidoreductase [Myceligenerans cantabricum]